MTTRWRRRQLCVLIAGTDAPANLRTVSANAAVLETGARPAIGASVTLRHPDAGEVRARVDAHHADGVALRLDGKEQAVAFALAAIVGDMSRPI